MVILSVIGGFLEIAVFLLAVLAFAWAVRFFMDSRKRLNELFPGLLSPGKVIPVGIDRNGFLVPKRVAKTIGTTGSAAFLVPKKKAADHTNGAIHELRLQLQQQQQELTKALQKIALSNGPLTTPEKDPADTINEQLALKELQAKLNAKDAEIQRLRQQEAYAQKLQEQFLDVQDAFEEVQEKLAQVERQAWQTAELSLQLEQATDAGEKLELALYKKEEKLHELTLENGQLRDACHKLESKLSEAHLQQQQLMRKVQLLEGLNTDILQMAEATRKLKNGIVRASELESMLQTITPGEHK